MSQHKLSYNHEDSSHDRGGPCEDKNYMAHILLSIISLAKIYYIIFSLLAGPEEELQKKGRQLSCATNSFLLLLDI